MANKSGVGLIIGGVVLILAGLFFLPFVVESEGEAVTAAAEAENATGQDVLDSQDERLLGMSSTVYLIGFIIGGIVLVAVGIWVLATRR